MIQNWMRYLVPTEWSVDQALLAVNLLKQAQDAIWHVHGAVMFDAIVLERTYAEHVADDIDLEARDHASGRCLQRRHPVLILVRVSPAI